MMSLKMVLSFCSGPFFLLVFFAAFSADNVNAQQALSLEEGLDYQTGRAIFEKIWVSSPSSTTASDGLGPLYNARSCAQCHQNGGKGLVNNSLVLHVNDEIYGRQIQTFAISGLKAEAKVSITYSLEQSVLSEGEIITLHRPVYSINNEIDGQLESLAYSPRIATSLAGLGLVEQIPQSQITALADEFDSNNDGISGRMNRVNAGAGQPLQPGLFGWKAGQATLARQSAKALNLDIGIGSALFPNPYGDCTNYQQSCLARANGNSPQHDDLEASTILMDSLLFYIRNIPAPISQKSEGEGLFVEAGCAACHHPGFELPGQAIQPYSDFLLHDMGPGLADNVDEALATGREWRTAPLWGISASRGLETTQYLHDGRARTLQEAILWHAGEAQNSVTRFKSMEKSSRDDLIRFLNGL